MSEFEVPPSKQSQSPLHSVNDQHVQPPLAPDMAAPPNGRGLAFANYGDVGKYLDESTVYPAALEPKRDDSGVVERIAHTLTSPFIDDEQEMYMATWTCTVTKEKGQWKGAWGGPTVFLKQAADPIILGQKKITGGLFVGLGGTNPWFPIGGGSAGVTASNDPALNGPGGQVNFMLGPYGLAYGHYAYMGGKVFNFWIQRLMDMYISEKGLVRFDVFLKILPLPNDRAVRCGGSVGARMAALQPLAKRAFIAADGAMATLPKLADRSEAGPPFRLLPDTMGSEQGPFGTEFKR